MTANLLRLTLGVMILLFPAQLIAGGPPMLCLPIDGVTQENFKPCGQLLSDKLHDKLWSHSDAEPGVRLQQHAGQWYMTFQMRADVALSDVEVALKETSFRIPRSKLRFFGHTTLAIDCPSPARAGLQADLESLECVSVTESRVKGNQVLVTLDMPYPVINGRQSRATVEWDRFERNDFASNPLTKSEKPVTSDKLPGYDRMTGLVAKHQGSLKDVFWSEHDACRVLGAVAVAPTSARE